MSDVLTFPAPAELHGDALETELAAAGQDARVVLGGDQVVLTGDDLDETTCADVVAAHVPPPPPTVWQPIEAFVNAWHNYGEPEGAFDQAKYRIDQTGAVHLHGLISGGALGAAAFVLPVEARPVKRLMFQAIHGGVAERLDVTADGEVQPRGSSNSFVSLNDVSYYPD